MTKSPITDTAKSASMVSARALLAVILEDNIFRTGSNGLDVWLTGILYFALLASTICVANAILLAYSLRKRKIKKGRESKDVVHWTWVHFFLGLALLAFLVTSILRYHHRAIKLASLTVRRAVHDTGKGFRKGKLTDHVPTGHDIMYNLYRWLYGKVPEQIVDGIPWMPLDWSRNASVWDYFKLLIDDGRRSWWTKQWFMGYLAWSVFVALECESFAISYTTATAFILLGTCFSLATAQSLFYVLLLLKNGGGGQGRHTQCGRIVFTTWVLPVLALIQSGVLAFLPRVLRWITDGDTFVTMWNKSFGLLQATLLLAPLSAPLLRHIVGHRVLVSEWLKAENMPKKTKIPYGWCALSILSALLHARASYNAFAQANVGRHSRWAQVGWLVPWRNEKSNGIQGTTFTAFRILGALGDDPWINALGWDVLFSVVGLCVWSVVSSADARGMLQCSLFPWLDDIIDVAGDAVKAAKDAAHNVVDKGKEAVSYLETIRSPEQRKIRRRQHELLESQIEEESSSTDSRRRSSRKKSGSRSRSQVGQDTQPDRRSRSRRSRRGDDEQDGQEHSTSIAPSKRSSRRLRSERARSTTPHGRQEAESPSSALVDEDLAGAAEQAGLAWALFVVGGLGCASSAVYGADVLET